MKTSQSSLHIIILTFLCILWISRKVCFAINGTVTDDITTEELEALNFTCTWRNDCKNTRTEGNDDLYSYHCMCDHHCVRYGACCLDSEFRTKLKETPDSDVDINCLYTYGANSRSVFMVDNCKNLGTINDLCVNNGEDWNDPFLLIPVTSKVSNITYKNYYCAVCNENSNADQLIFWTIIVDDTFNSTTESQVPKLEFSRALQSWVIVDPNVESSTKVTISIKALEKPEVKYCIKDLITECDRKWTDAAIAEKCKAYMSTFTIYDRYMGSLSRYKNPHCAICNFEALSRRRNKCFNVLNAMRHEKYEGGRRFEVNDEEKKCGGNAMYDIFSKKCRCNSESSTSEDVEERRNCVLRL